MKWVMYGHVHDWWWVSCRETRRDKERGSRRNSSMFLSLKNFSRESSPEKNATSLNSWDDFLGRQQGPGTMKELNTLMNHRWKILRLGIKSSGGRHQKEKSSFHTKDQISKRRRRRQRIWVCKKEPRGMTLSILWMRGQWRLFLTGVKVIVHSHFTQRFYSLL